MHTIKFENLQKQFISFDSSMVELYFHPSVSTTGSGWWFPSVRKRKNAWEGRLWTGLCRLPCF